MSTTKTSATLWAEYLALKAGRRLADMPADEAAAACRVHEEYLRVELEESRQLTVRGVNTMALQRALDWGGNEYETENGELVRVGATFLVGSPTALEDLVSAAEERAEDSIQDAGTWDANWADAGTPAAERRLRSMIEAVDRAAAKVRAAIVEWCVDHE